MGIAHLYGEDGQPVTIDSASRAVAVTPADGADLAATARALYVGVGGDLAVVLAGDTSPVTFVGVAAGMILPLEVKRVRSTGTTCTSILALY